MNFDWHDKKIYIGGIISLLLLGTVASLLFMNQSDTEEELVSFEEKSGETEVTMEIAEPLEIEVDIKGAVVNPGLYSLEEGSRVQDVIEKSGGLTKDADTSMINLSKKVTDEMVIIIYTKKEIESMRNGNTTIKYIEKECVCPSIENDGCIESPETNHDPSNTTDDNKETKISINKASLEELMKLPGIGESKAQKIIDYRNKNGLFKNIEDLKNVDGIGTTTFENLKDLITL